MDAIELKEEERTPCEIWSRVMGYHRPTRLWNVGKQQEHADRLLFREPAPSASDMKPAPHSQET